MLIFILAVLAMFMSWLIGEPPGKGSAEEGAWAEAPPLRQTMTTNLRVRVGGGDYLFFPSDALYFQHTTPVSEEQKRRTAYLGTQSSMVMYLPQQRAVREQQAKHGAKPGFICARAPQDVNAAIKWEATEADDKSGVQKTGDKRPAANVHIPRPFLSLAKMHAARAPRFNSEAESDAAWRAMMEKLKKNLGTPVDLTEDLGAQGDGRVFVKSSRGVPIAALWRVTPVTHAMYKYRIEIEQDTTSPGSTINTAIFASTDEIKPCLDLSERISAHAVGALKEAQARTLLD